MAHIKWQAAARRAIDARLSLSADREAMHERMRELLNQIEADGKSRRRRGEENAREGEEEKIEARKEILHLFRANRDFIKESLRLCLKHCGPPRLKAYLDLARRAVGSNAGEKFWRDLFLSLYERAVDKGDAASLKVLLSAAHDPPRPLLKSKPRVNCRALVHACLMEDRQMVALFVDREYTLKCTDERIVGRRKKRKMSAWAGLPWTHPEESVSATKDSSSDDDDDVDSPLVPCVDNVTNLHILAAMSKPCYILTCYDVANREISQHSSAQCDLPHCDCKNSNSFGEAIEAINPEIDELDAVAKYERLPHCCPRASKYRPELGCRRHLPCNDPIFWSFKIRKMASRAAEKRPEYKEEYKEIARACSDLPVRQLNLCQDTGEVELVLEDETGCRNFFDWSTVGLGSYPRLQMAIFNNDMAFISQKYCQEILRNLWYGNVPWHDKPFHYQVVYTIVQTIMLIWWCLIYASKLLLEDFPKLEKVIKSKSVISYIKRHGNLDEPLNRFISFSIMYLLYVSLITTCAFNPVINPSELTNNFQVYHQVLALLVFAFFMQDTFSVFTCVSNIRGTTYLFWKTFDFIVQGLVVIAFFVRFLMGGLHECKDEQCDVETLDERLPYDTVSNCFFALACILVYVRLLYWFQLEEKMGPIIIQLSRVIIDVFTFIFVLGVLLIAFTTALVPLKAINMRCDNFTSAVYDHEHSFDDVDTYDDEENVFGIADDCWYTWSSDLFTDYFRQMLGLLFWGILNPEFPDDDVFHNDDWEGVFAAVVYAVYCVAAIVVLLNLLVAIMNNTIQRVHDRKNAYWKFVRTSIWMEFFGEAYAMPPPFGLFVVFRAIVILIYDKVAKLLKKENRRKNRRKIMFWRTATSKNNGTAPLIPPDTIETVDGRLAASVAVQDRIKEEVDRRKQYDGLMTELIERYWERDKDE